MPKDSRNPSREAMIKFVSFDKKRKTTRKASRLSRPSRSKNTGKI